MIDYELWKKNIFSSIIDISDIEFQEKSWMGKSEQHVSTFSEDISMLYDSFCFADDFWDKQHLLNFNFTDDVLLELKKLKELIDLYKRKSTDAEILRDPEWNKVVAQAKKIVAIWK